MNKVSVFKLLILAFVTFSFASCSNSENITYPTPKDEWCKTLLGNGMILGAYPDFYVNYWEYTYDVTKNPNVALCLKGEFPHSRYFSISLYNDLKGSAIGSIEDHLIIPDEGSVNPFVETSNEKNYFTIYIVPETMSEENINRLGCKNIAVVKSGVEHLALCERQYLGTKSTSDQTSDEYGGVDLPKITSIDINTLQPVSLPEHIESNVNNSPNNTYELQSDTLQDVPFFLASQDGYYPNYATNYLYGRTILESDSILMFSFIPVDIPATVEEYADANARYWSICFGSTADTRSYYSRCDKNAIYKNGEKCTFIVCKLNNPKFEELKNTVESLNQQNNYINFCPWDSEYVNVDGKTLGNGIAVMYRQISPNKNWEHSISTMLPTPYYNKTTKIQPIDYANANEPNRRIADLALGDYGIRGVKYSTNDLIKILGDLAKK